MSVNPSDTASTTRVAFVTQDNYLFGDTIRENIPAGTVAEATDQECRDGCKGGRM